MEYIVRGGGTSGIGRVRAGRDPGYRGKGRRALIGTKNSSASGPDGISYRLIKPVTDTPLGEELINEVADQPLEGTIRDT